MAEAATHRPVITPGRCNSCGLCSGACPTAAYGDLVPRSKFHHTRHANECPIPPDASTVAGIGTDGPACQKACPIHQDARGYVALIAQRKFHEAVARIREVNPLPAVCGYVCHHPCEDACVRQIVDSPIPIRRLKRFAAEYEMTHPGLARPRIRKRTGRVVVAGSGPAGLAAAHDLALLGYGVTVMEALPVLGGMLSVGIPSFRLPREVLEQEVRWIRDLGVEMIPGRPFQFENAVKELRMLRFNAGFLAIGAHQSSCLNIPGESLKGVFPGVEFLREFNLGQPVELGARVAVIGGGNVAIDAARSAHRLGAASVDVYYRRSRKEMPAIAGEIDEAIAEGIRIHFLSSPARIIGRGGRVRRLECVRMTLQDVDETGRGSPVAIDGSNFFADVDSIITAIGQRVDANALRLFSCRKDGTIQIDAETGETSVEGFFAGGDVVTGPGYAIDAIAMGKRGAASIHRYLS